MEAGWAVKYGRSAAGWFRKGADGSPERTKTLRENEPSQLANQPTISLSDDAALVKLPAQ